MLAESRGHLLLTGSVAGRVLIPGSLYSATKWAVSALAASIRAECVGTGVRVTLVQPGLTDTDPVSPGREGDPKLDPGDVARAVLYAVSQPAGVDATYYINSGTIGTSNHLTWSEVQSLSTSGDDIGGKTVDGTNLTTLSTQQQVSEICNDVQNIEAHGITPLTFAYPSGASNAAIQAEVQSCGYGNARTAGSLSPTGSTYAETLPPRSWLALRAYAPSGQVTLANLESLVTGAAAKGGWVPIVIGKVCSSTLDPSRGSQK